MRDTIANYQLMKEVMADLREHGAMCCFYLTGEYPNKDRSIGALLSDGRVWEIPSIEVTNGENVASVNEKT